MLKRAWYVLAGLWALIVFSGLAINATPENRNMSLFPMLFAFGPLAVPFLFGAFVRFVRTGSPRKTRGAYVIRG